MRSPLDEPSPGTQAWEGFRVSFASAYFWIWFLRDLYDAPIDYVGQLREAFGAAELRAKKRVDDDPAADPQWEIQESARIIRLDWDMAELLKGQLFHDSATEKVVQARLYAFASIAVYSALEALAREVGVNTTGRSLADNVNDFLCSRSAPRLDVLTTDSLRLLGAVRHVYMHRHGVADEMFIRQAFDPPFRIGERVLIDDRRADEFAQAAWRAAARIRAVFKQG